jgi:selenocysteine lyase/cysteine desulfurase
MVDLDAVARELRRGDVQLVAMSMASNVTGDLAPYEALLSLAHDHGALCLLDGAQVAGWIPLDLAALDVDLFAFAGHKGPQAPWGIGGLYVRPGVLLDTPGASCDGAVCRTGPGYCDTGSVNLPALVGLAAGLRWMAQRAPWSEAQRVMGTFREAVAEVPGVRCFGDGRGMPTCSLTVDGWSAAEVGARLRDRGFVVSAGTQCAPRAHATLGTGDAGTVRISAGPATTEDEVLAAGAALAEIVGA